MKKSRYAFLAGAVAAVALSILSYSVGGTSLPLVAGRPNYTLTLSGSKNKLEAGYESDQVVVQTDAGNDFYMVTNHTAAASAGNFITLPSDYFSSIFYSSASSSQGSETIRNLISVSVTCSANGGNGIYMNLYSNWAEEIIFYSSEITDTATHTFTSTDFGTAAPTDLWFKFGLVDYFATYSVTIQSIVFAYAC